ncbi:dUTP pyrophosphatase [Lactarius sanguifluus]|nr:dUTP pyrophosphatase [Lactarius sanguifluus]
MATDLPETKKRKVSPAPDAEGTISTPTSNLLIKRLSEKAKLPTKLPTRGSALAAGYDALVDTQLSIAVPPGTYGRVAPRSGLASKFMINTGAGVVDADYRGVLYVLLFNHSDTDFTVEEGDRIAQLVIERIETPSVVEVDVRVVQAAISMPY